MAKRYILIDDEDEDIPAHYITKAKKGKKELPKYRQGAAGCVYKLAQVIVIILLAILGASLIISSIR